jgi:hypothetical protein
MFGALYYNSPAKENAHQHREILFETPCPFRLYSPSKRGKMKISFAALPGQSCIKS